MAYRRLMPGRKSGHCGEKDNSIMNGWYQGNGAEQKDIDGYNLMEINKIAWSNTQYNENSPYIK